MDDRIGYVRTSRARWATLALLVFVVGTLSVPALAHHRPGHVGGGQPAHNKEFTAQFHLVGAHGGDLELELKITNRTGDQNLGSVNAYPPTGVSLVGVTQQPATGIATTGTFEGRAALQLRNLSLPPNGTATVRFTVDACSDQAWAVEARQSNEFSGTGNEIFLASAGNTLVVDCEFETEVCEEAGPCEVSISNDDQTVTVSGNLKDGASLLLAFTDDQLDCQGSNSAYPWNHAPQVTLFDLSGGTVDGEPLTVEMTIHLQEDATEPLPTAATYQICFLGDLPFYDIDGTLIGQANQDGTYGEALLQGCGSDWGTTEIPYPCVESWVNEGDGDRTVTFFIPAEDPRFQ